MDEKTERWLKLAEKHNKRCELNDGAFNCSCPVEYGQRLANLLRALLEEREAAEENDLRRDNGSFNRWRNAKIRVNALLAEIPDA